MGRLFKKYTFMWGLLLVVSLFPQYGSALAVCVIHHVVHLIMDGYLVGRLQPPRGTSAGPMEAPPARQAIESD